MGWKGVFLRIQSWTKIWKNGDLVAKSFFSKKLKLGGETVNVWPRGRYDTHKPTENHSKKPKHI